MRPDHACIRCAGESAPRAIRDDSARAGDWDQVADADSALGGDRAALERVAEAASESEYSRYPDDIDEMPDREGVPAGDRTTFLIAGQWRAQEELLGEAISRAAAGEDVRIEGAGEYVRRRLEEEAEDIAGDTYRGQDLDGRTWAVRVSR